jgi:hypothetical protein
MHALAVEHVFLSALLTRSARVIQFILSMQQNAPIVDLVLNLVLLKQSSLKAAYRLLRAS